MTNLKASIEINESEIIKNPKKHGFFRVDQETFYTHITLNQKKPALIACNSIPSYSEYHSNGFTWERENTVTGFIKLNGYRRSFYITNNL